MGTLQIWSALSISIIRCNHRAYWDNHCLFCLRDALQTLARTDFEGTRHFPVAAAKLYYSPRLSASGRQLYPELLRTAARSGTDDSLASELRVGGRLNTTEERRKPKGGTTIAQAPVTAPETLAKGEFNRFYARGLCRRAMAQGIESVVVYRAKDVVNPRSESLALIGKTLPVKRLLEDLRASIGTDTALGLPPGPNSGLSVKLP